jgi:ParB family transcriptional regulator, chromosome partitioning protein
VTADGKAQRRRGLGMGLSALLGGDAETYAPETRRTASQNVPIEFMGPSPLQPRRRFDEAELDALAESIRERGILQPLLVRPAASGAVGYEIVAGERRWRAAQRAGLHEVPAVIRELSDQETLELALVENLQRADLSPLDEAQAFRRLVDEFGHTQDEVAAAIGKSRSHVANTLRLLALPAAVLALVADGSLTAGHARALIGCAGAERLARAVIERGLNVRDTEALVRLETRRAQPARRDGGAADPHARELEERLTAQLGLEVGIRAKRRGGVLTIRYHDLGQLDGLIRRLQ